jgi:hypothetical protein
MSFISFAITHLPSSGMGEGPFFGPFATHIIFSTSLEYFIGTVSLIFILYGNISC